jgi:hypothetical protein
MNQARRAWQALADLTVMVLVYLRVLRLPDEDGQSGQPFG